MHTYCKKRRRLCDERGGRELIIPGRKTTTNRFVIFDARSDILLLFFFPMSKILKYAYSGPQVDWNRTESVMSGIDTILRALAAKDVMLSAYGNDSGRGTLKTEEMLCAHVDRLATFNVENVARAGVEIPQLWCVTAVERFVRSSYGMKHTLEHYRNNVMGVVDGYISNGDFIVAMLFNGFTCNFGDAHAPEVICAFNAKWHGPKEVR